MKLFNLFRRGEEPSPAPKSLPAVGGIAEAWEDVSPVRDITPIDGLDPIVQRALDAVGDGAPCLVAVTYLDGDCWRHVVCTRDFPRSQHKVAVRKYADQLQDHREAS